MTKDLIIDSKKILWRGIIYFISFNLAITLAMDLGYFKENNSIYNSGIPYILGSFFGLSIIFFLSSKKLYHDFFKNSSNLMNLKNFLILVLLLFSIQWVSGYITDFLESLLNIFKLSAFEQIKAAGGNVTTPSMILYSVLIAPISEEIVFRGYFLRNFQKYGNTFAIVTTSILFSLFHTNFAQTPFAFLIGLELGYVALKYNIFWSMGLHLINNLILSEGFNYLDKLLGGYFLNFIMSSLGIIGIAILFKKRQQFFSWFEKNPLKKGVLLKIFTTLPGILIIVGAFYTIFSNLTAK